MTAQATPIPYRVNLEHAPAFQELLDRFAAAQDVGPRTRESYRQALRRFFDHVQATGAAGSPATRQTILDYKAALNRRGLSPYTVNLYMTAVRRFFAWAESERMSPNIARGVKGVRNPGNRNFQRDALTRDQAAAVLNQVDRSTLQGKRDHALLTILMIGGRRTIEIVRANVGDLDRVRGVLRYQGKGHTAKDAMQKMTPLDLPPLLDYLAARGNPDPAAPLFASLSDRNEGQRMTTRSISRIVKHYLRAAGIDSPRLTAHSLRHSAATWAYMGGATLPAIQQMLGHGNINTTMIYAHTVDRMKDAAELKVAAFLQGI